MSSSPILSRLKGKQVCFNGKFDWGVQERLSALAEAQSGVVTEDVDAKTDYLVLPDLTAGKTIQKKVLSLNSKGASIQVIAAADFEKLIEPTEAEIVALIRAGTKKADLFNKAFSRRIGQHRTIANENFDGIDLSGFDFYETAFENCSFVGATFQNGNIQSIKNCNFSLAIINTNTFIYVENSNFSKVNASNLNLSGFSGDLNFKESKIVMSRFGFLSHRPSTKAAYTAGNLHFEKADLRSCMFSDVFVESMSFVDAKAVNCTFHGPYRNLQFQLANLTGSSFVGCKLKQADFRGAILERANFADADLSNAIFDSADLKQVSFRGAILTNVDFSKAKNYNRDESLGGNVGPAMKELDDIVGKAKRIQFTFCLDLQVATGQPPDVVDFDSARLRWSGGMNLPHRLGHNRVYSRNNNAKASDGILEAARLIGNTKIRFETIDVSTTKSPANAAAVRDVLIKALSEAFNQQPPEEAKLAELTKAWREEQKESTAADRERKEKARAAAEKEAEKAKKQIAKKIEKEVGKVTDIATFLKALELRADKSKIDKATKMLKAEKFQLFNDITDEHMAGVVKSQTDPDLVYACRINAKGEYACCTQNLNICGGLRGSPCKHLLVLIIGLVKAGKLDPTTIDTWVAKSGETKPALDKEKMGEIFIRYKGAEAGEVDWRPTETLPEDYYSL